MHDSTSIRQRPGVTIPRYPVLLATVVAICTVGMAVNLVAAILADVEDEGPRTLQEQLAGVLGFGAGGIVLALVGAWWFSQSPSRSRIGAIVFGALSVPTLILFFSGVPGMFGATAAFLAGLTAGRVSEQGTPRVFGIVGLTLAVLNMVVAMAGIAIAWLT